MVVMMLMFMIFMVMILATTDAVIIMVMVLMITAPMVPIMAREPSMWETPEVRRTLMSVYFRAA
mgnify:CR=1 FL=1